MCAVHRLIIHPQTVKSLETGGLSMCLFEGALFCLIGLQVVVDS